MGRAMAARGARARLASSGSAASPWAKSSRTPSGSVLLLQRLHPMLLILKYGRGERIFSMHPEMGQREHYDVFRVLREETAKDASLVPGIVDFRNDLPGFDSIGDPLRPQ